MSHELTKSGPQPINIFLESLTSDANFGRERSAEEVEARLQKDEAILVLLGKLALVYWRPDFTPGQAKQLYAQYLDDLRCFAFKDIAEAVETYRQNGENKFFPTPGQLRSIIATPYSWDPSPKKHLSERLHAGQVELRQMAQQLPQLTGSAQKRIAAQ